MNVWNLIAFIAGIIVACLGVKLMEYLEDREAL
jgi:hypothetical protein